MSALIRRLRCSLIRTLRGPQARLWALLLLVGPMLGAQNRVLGAQDCKKCHKAAEKKWRLEEPASDPKAHASTNKQLTDPKAAGFARAINLADPAQAGGRCVECHATVVRGLVRGGVSCESCHGAASAYLDPHDDEPLAASYARSVKTLGLRDLHAKPAEIARLCVSCHVTPDRALIQAKHPSGADFDAGAGLKKLVHWTAAFTGDGNPHASYDYAQVTSVARGLIQRALAGAPAPPRPASGERPVEPTRPARETPQPARPAAAPAPLSLFDDGVVVLQCPPDCPSDDTEPAPAPAGPQAAAPAAPATRPASRVAPRSIVIDAPAFEAPALEPPPPAAPPDIASAPSLGSRAAALRGRAADLLARLLASGKRAPSLPEPAPPAEFEGPDSELLNLQDLALQLALESLRKQ